MDALTAAPFRRLIRLLWHRGCIDPVDVNPQADFEATCMTYYARVVFNSNASVAERYEDLSAACNWIEAERHASPESFRLGQVYEGTQAPEIVATCDLKGWHSS
jgi:hypothetical protein